jgi:perosamine synthetase
MITIPIAQPVAGKVEQGAVTKVLKSGMLAMGSQVARFEQDYASFCTTRHAIAVNSGTSALHSALACAGIHWGDEVIVPSFTFFATASCVSMCGARPVFADVHEDTFCIDAESVMQRISKNTRAILGVHLFGQPFDVSAISDIAEDKRLMLFEDAAQAHGSEYRGKRVGGLGKAGCFSFYPTKNMTTGEGGMVTTDEDEYAMEIRRFINHGQSEKYRHTMIGYNYRMTDIGAAIGQVQLRNLIANTKKRISNAEYLTKNIVRKGIVKPYCIPQGKHVYHQYVVRVTEECDVNREELIRQLTNAGIGTAVHYPAPVHRQPVYQKEYGDCSLPISEQLSEEVLSLPVHPGLTRPMLKRICDAVNGVT